MPDEVVTPPVSVPLRGLGVFGDGSYWVVYRHGISRFRPLAGIRGIRRHTKKQFLCFKNSVSVPLRGLGVFGGELEQYVRVSDLSAFPSPCGD